MVRILPVHNFIAQHVEKIDEPTASCTANIMDQDLLLLAHSSHCVKVYGLATNQSKLLTIFPTVDLVHQLLHSDKGNYVATLESKTSRDGSTMNNFVRIYVNWEMAGNQNQPMRARIAGRVTPSLNRSLNSLEMIELPLNGQPSKIACCQATGNLLIAMGVNAVIHELKVETQQTSRHKFLDFEVRPWSISFSFVPKHMELAEEFISVMDSTNFMLFRLTNRFHEDSWTSKIDTPEKGNNIRVRRRSNQNNLENRDDSKDEEKSRSSSSNEQSRKSSKDFSKSINNEHVYINWDEIVLNEQSELQRIQSLNLVDAKLKTVTISLPTIEAERAQSLRTLHPLIFSAPETTATITTRSNEDSWSENYFIEHLLRLKISKTSADGTQNPAGELFTCTLLQPTYKRQKITSASTKRSLLRSSKYNLFNGVNCLICTSQEGYLYYFSPRSRTEVSLNTSCCRKYAFTASVSHVALDSTALHALTDAGLESYTLRIPNEFSDASHEGFDEKSVLLIGLRPFLGVKNLLHASKYLILLAGEQESWRLECLHLPAPEDVYQDILNAANNHKLSSPSTYKHLLSEAYNILRLAKDVVYYSSDATFTNSISEATKLQLNTLYKQSCALLADFFISSETHADWTCSSHYYRLAGLKAHDVLARKDVRRAQGLVLYLSECLLALEPGPEADALFQEHNIVEVLTAADRIDFLKLILASPVLREYATEKLINLLPTWEPDNMTLLALTLLYTQAGRQPPAEKALAAVSDRFAKEKVLSNWSWLFEVTNTTKGGNIMPTFSDFAGTLMKQKSKVFSEVLAKIVERDALSLDQMIPIFLGYLPSRVGRDGRIAAIALQQFLETYLRNFYSTSICLKSSDFAVVEAFKILVRSYLAELAQTNFSNFDGIGQEEEEEIGDEDILFGKMRPNFLDHPLLYIKDEKNCVEETDVTKKCVRLEVRKLQALLSSRYLPEECFHEVKHFLATQRIEGSLSFRLLCTKTTEESVQLLVDECPQVLLEFVKHKYTQESDWKEFVEFLMKKMAQDDPNVRSVYDELMKATTVHIAQTMSMRGLQRILPNDSLPALQKYIDMSNQVVHADYIKTMIMNTGQHLLCNINF